MNGPSVFPFVLPSGGIHNIQQHTFGLARYTYMLLSSLCHGNGRPAAQIYAEGQFESPSTQGAILNFNLMDSSGHIIGCSQVNLTNSSFSLPRYCLPFVYAHAEAAANFEKSSATHRSTGWQVCTTFMCALAASATPAPVSTSWGSPMNR